MFKQFQIFLIFLIASAACLGGYHLIGASVDANGFLVEPFGLIPISWVLLLAAMVSAIAGLIRRDQWNKKATTKRQRPLQ